MPTDPIQAMEFAQSKGQARKDGRTGVTFADVAGCDEAVRQLRFVVEVLLRNYPIFFLACQPDSRFSTACKASCDPDIKSLC